ncbi:hypothetical protein LCGC14_3149920, partial [marine sediment metagenome]
SKFNIDKYIDTKKKRKFPISMDNKHDNKLIINISAINLSVIFSIKPPTANINATSFFLVWKNVLKVIKKKKRDEIKERTAIIITKAAYLFESVVLINNPSSNRISDSVKFAASKNAKILLARLTDWPNNKYLLSFLE